MCLPRVCWVYDEVHLLFSCFRRALLQAVGLFHKKHSDRWDGRLLALTLNEYRSGGFVCLSREKERGDSCGFLLCGCVDYFLAFEIYSSMLFTVFTS